MEKNNALGRVNNTELRFFKYQGTGNDFILIDDRKLLFKKTNSKYIAYLCDRKFGIGADGLILLRNHLFLDFEMIYFNPNGEISSMCGNGGRCAVVFAHKLNIFKNQTQFQAIDGLHKAQILQKKRVKLKMIDVCNIQYQKGDFISNTGSPHYIRFVRNVTKINIYEEARKIRYSPNFKKEGINVDFVEIIDNRHLKVRTYERGVENETLSCGTGATAAALSATFMGYKSPINIETLGGRLAVDFQKENNTFRNIYLSGSAEEVFEGKIKTFLKNREINYKKNVY